jgi:hypothetical protein
MMSLASVLTKLRWYDAAADLELAMLRLDLPQASAADDLVADDGDER